MSVKTVGKIEKVLNVLVEEILEQEE